MLAPRLPSRGMGPTTTRDAGATKPMTRSRKQAACASETESVATRDEPAGPPPLVAADYDDAHWLNGIARFASLEHMGVLVVPGAAEGLEVGDRLVFAHSGVRKVVALTRKSHATNIVVDGVLHPLFDGHPYPIVRPPAGAEASWLFDNGGIGGPDDYVFGLLNHANPAPPRPVAASGTGRILVVTIVPPAPANQGNRVVTANLVSHLLGLGHAVDILYQGPLSAKPYLEAFGARCRLFHIDYPSWRESEEGQARQAISKALAQHPASKLNSALLDGVRDAVGLFHPYYILRDDTVRYAELLLNRVGYDYVVCNYLHSKRVLDELAARLRLPPSCVVTHDALSQLPASVAGKPLDTGYSRCTAADEAACLDRVETCVPVAITADEAAYFKAIGVSKLVVVCEHDAVSELEGRQTNDDSFGSKVLIFHGSANPLNTVALERFITACWPEIVRRFPRARLKIAGSVCRSLRITAVGVESLGELPRAALLAACVEATLAINPSLAGTGLKIKTVEAAAMGLPSVVFPSAVDGLQDDAERFARVARTEAEFVEHCVRLLTDRNEWSRLREGALAFARERFSAPGVYAALDAAMGWAKPRGKKAKPAAAVATAGEPAGGDAQAAWLDVEARRRARRDDLALACAAAPLALAAGHPMLALAHAADAIALEPALPAGYLAAARALTEKDPARAFGFALRAVCVEPGDREALEAMEQLARRLDRHEEADWARGSLDALRG